MKTGFGFVQLNTNGFFLARNPDLAPRLKDAGLASVFLQFDGVTDTVYEALRGRPLIEDKQRAVAACVENDIGGILVPTLVPGVNIDQIGPFLDTWINRTMGLPSSPADPLEAFGAKQLRALNRIIAHARDHSRFYRESLFGIADVPLVDLKDMAALLFTRPAYIRENPATVLSRDTFLNLVTLF